MRAKLIKDHDDYHLVNDEQFVIGTTDESILSCTDKYKLSLKNCKAIELGYDLDELAKTLVEEEIHDGSSAIGLRPLLEEFVQLGFQKALSILGDKKFSEEDMSTILITFLNDIMNMKYRGNEVSIINQLLQSLQQTEWDVIVEMEKVKDETKIIGSVKGVKGSGDKITTYKSIPKLDTDGCLILKRK